MLQNARRRFLVGAGAIAAATLARARRPAKMVRLGVLTQVNTLRTPVWESFFLALSKRGWREGIDYSLEVKEGYGDPARYLELARELIQQPVDLVLAITTAPAVALKQVSDRIPVVAWCGYPVEAGLAASLARPGGNVTGVASYAGADVWGKFPELLRELKPGLRELGVLWDYVPPRLSGWLGCPADDQAGCGTIGYEKSDLDGAQSERSHWGAVRSRAQPGRSLGDYRVRYNSRQPPGTNSHRQAHRASLSCGHHRYRRRPVCSNWMHPRLFSPRARGSGSPGSPYRPHSARRPSKRITVRVAGEVRPRSEREVCTSARPQDSPVHPPARRPGDPVTASGSLQDGALQVCMPANSGLQDDAPRAARA